LVSATHKQTLPNAECRKLDYYFVADCSDNSPVDYHISMIEDYTALHSIQDAQIIFTSYNIAQVPLNDIRSTFITPKSGFNLAMAIRHILSTNGEDTVPIIIFVSGNPANAILPEHSSWLAKRFPESPYYYRLRDDFKLVPYSFDNNTMKTVVSSPDIITLRSYQGTYVQDNNESEIVSTSYTNEYIASGNQYMDALALDTVLRRQPFLGKSASLEMLRASFRNHTLTPQTAFIVVETAEQEAEIWKAQQELMKQEAFTARETVVTLDEPPIVLTVILIGFLGCMVLLARRRGRRIS